jgi:hypothetical protein
MSFGIYAVGFAIMICRLMYGAHLMHVPVHWIAVGAIVLFRRWDSVRSKGDAPERLFVGVGRSSLGEVVS